MHSAPDVGDACHVSLCSNYCMPLVSSLAPADGRGCCAPLLWGHVPLPWSLPNVCPSCGHYLLCAPPCSGCYLLCPCCGCRCLLWVVPALCSIACCAPLCCACCAPLMWAVPAVAPLLWAVHAVAPLLCASAVGGACCGAFTVGSACRAPLPCGPRLQCSLVWCQPYTGAASVGNACYFLPDSGAHPLVN